MLGNEFTYFKFITEIIDAGIWAKMSPAARTLYPVLLRFSDRHFSPVYPGTKKLLELTGFKQKASLRMARKELIELGLISVTLGKGRSNTVYHFRFDWIQRGKNIPSDGYFTTPLRGSKSSHREVTTSQPMGYPVHPPYNQIQISINHQPSTNEKNEIERDPFDELRKMYGSRNVDLAISEAKLADLKPDHETISRILSRSYTRKETTLEELLAQLKEKISENSFQLIQKSFIEMRDGYLIFSDTIPIYLKNILIKFSDFILFEPMESKANLTKTREAWRKHEY